MGQPYGADGWHSREACKYAALKHVLLETLVAQRLPRRRLVSLVKRLARHPSQGPSIAVDTL